MARWTPSPGTPGITLYYLYDPLGNVSDRLNDSQQVISSDLYDAYGARQSGTSTDPCGYNGQYGYYTDRQGEGDSGLILCTYRYYDPASSQWLTRDPIGFAGGMNLYGYCEGEPVGGVDARGLTVRWHHRPAFGMGFRGTGYEHWWLSTDAHPFTGLSAPSLTFRVNEPLLPYGNRLDISFESHIMSDRYGNTLNYPDVSLDLHCTREQERRLDEVIHNVKSGWIMDGKDWNHAPYFPTGKIGNIGIPNCEDFVQALLRKAGIPEIAALRTTEQIITDFGGPPRRAGQFQWYW